MSEPITNCRNCNQTVNDNFCAKCGHAVQLKRIDGNYIWHEIVHVLHFEKGIFYTVRELLMKPGKNIRAFISTDRNRLVKPVIFIIITSLIYTIASHFFHNQDSFIKIEAPNSAATDAINRWIHQNYGYSNILEGLFIALWLKIFFSKSDYNFYEIVILLCFTMGIGMLIFSLAVVLTGLIHVDLLQTSGIVFFVYITWAIGQFFDGKRIMSYVKAFAAYALGMGTFLGLSVLLGNLIDLIMA